MTQPFSGELPTLVTALARGALAAPGRRRPGGGPRRGSGRQVVRHGKEGRRHQSVSMRGHRAAHGGPVGLCQRRDGRGAGGMGDARGQRADARAHRVGDHREGD